MPPSEPLVLMGVFGVGALVTGAYIRFARAWGADDAE
jgi:hypothetical protein